MSGGNKKVAHNEIVESSIVDNARLYSRTRVVIISC